MKKADWTMEDVTKQLAKDFGGGDTAIEKMVPTPEAVQEFHDKVMRISLRVKKLPHYGDLPDLNIATIGSVGVDLFAAVNESVCLNTTGARAMIPTGIALELPVGFEAQIRPRSGLASKNGISVLNSPGTIDCIPLYMPVLCSDDSYRTLEEIIETKITTIKSFNEETNQIEDDYIKDIWKVGEKETLSITFDDDTVIEVTKTQLILTENGWKYAKDLTTLDSIISI